MRRAPAFIWAIECNGLYNQVAALCCLMPATQAKITWGMDRQRYQHQYSILISLLLLEVEHSPSSPSIRNERFPIHGVGRTSFPLGKARGKLNGNDRIRAEKIPHSRMIVG